MYFKKQFTIPLLVFILIGLYFLVQNNSDITLPEKEETKSFKAKTAPADWFLRQRAFPHCHVPTKELRKTIKQIQQRKKLQNRNTESEWVFSGPTNIGGRITDIEMPSDDVNTIYACAAAGGIFKSTDQGATWEPIFDDAPTLSIGDLAIAPSDPAILYAGTGEVNAGGGSLTYDGFGVFKSVDSGASWTSIGLEDIGSIGKVAVHPTDAETVFVAAMGNLFGNNPERGLFRTQDGGANWEQVLTVNDSTGAVDVIIHPDDPNIILASMWQRVRRPQYRDYGGPGSGLFRSMDGGENWEELTNGLPTQNVGRIDLALAPSEPNTMYAHFAHKDGHVLGIFKTSDAGDSWNTINQAGIESVPYMWWFGGLTVAPDDPDNVFMMGFDLYKINNSQSFWSLVGSNMHVDHHALFIHPQNTNLIFSGNDGGIYKSTNGGASWAHLNNMPITQFYTCEMDEQFPERIYGGTQDNSPIRTLTGNLDDWQVILFGDGFVTQVDPENNSYIYTEYQYGNFYRSTNGGASFNEADLGIFGRRNWNTPFVLEPGNPSTLYLGTDRVFKSTNYAGSWNAISVDLTNGSPASVPNAVNLTYGTITALAASPVDNNILYAGTDDGNLWNTLDGGTSWNLVSESLPERWITNIACDHEDPATAYVTISGFRYDEYLPHVFKTIDDGESWEDISGNLPEIPVNDIIIDPDQDMLYVATDVGIFYTIDENNWDILGTGLPNLVITDLDFHQGSRTLLAATYGRSMYKIILEVDTKVEENYNNIFTETKLYPNPVTEQSVLEMELTKNVDFAVAIFDIHGKVVDQIHSGKLFVGKHSFEIARKGNYPAGNYICKISGAGFQKNVKFVVP